MGGLPGKSVGIRSGSRMGGPMSTRTRWTRPPETSRSSVRIPRPVSIGHLLLAGQAVVVKILGDAAHAVAAHLAFRAVGVEHPHPGIGSFRGHDQDQAVAADAEMAIADRRSASRRGIGGRRLIERAHVDVIVADPVHLGESHRSVARVGEFERDRTGSEYRARDTMSDDGACQRRITLTRGPAREQETGPTASPFRAARVCGSKPTP